MTDAELLRAMAQWYRDGNAFAPDVNSQTCFAFAADHFDGSIPNVLRDVAGLGESISTQTLIDAGWTGPECTDDAIAACEIAADLAS